MEMTREEGEAFAARWAEAWNRRAFDEQGLVTAAEVFHGVHGSA